jgi:acid phosphatase family membrane protein YuiD
MICEYFFPNFVHFLFTSLIASLEAQKLNLSIMSLEAQKFNLSIMSFVGGAFGVTHENVLPN